VHIIRSCLTAVCWQHTLVFPGGVTGNCIWRLPDHTQPPKLGYDYWRRKSRLAEFERNVIRERTLAGLKAARARGRLGGRPEKLSAKDKQQIRVLLKDPAVRVKDVAQRFGISVATLYKRVGVVTPEK